MHSLLIVKTNWPEPEAAPDIGSEYALHAARTGAVRTMKVSGLKVTCERCQVAALRPWSGIRIPEVWFPVPPVTSYLLPDQMTA